MSSPVPTHRVNIYIGLKEGYDGPIHTLEEARDICKNYCNEMKIGMSLTPTEFIYVDGNEPGIIVGLINYPRFPSALSRLIEHAIVIGKRLMELFKQHRISIVTDEQTVMLESV